MRITPVVTLVLFATIPFFWKAQASDVVEGWTVSDLLAIAPRVALNQKDIHSFEIGGEIQVLEMRLRFVALGEKPHKIALRLIDARDGTPILVGNNETVMYYDPLSGEVLWCKGSPHFSIRVDNEPTVQDKADDKSNKLVFGFGVHLPLPKDKKRAKEEKKEPQILIDIQSIFKNLQRLEVKTVQGSDILLSCRSKKGNRVEAHIMPSRPQGPYTHVAIYYRDPVSGNQLSTSIDNIRLNHTISPERFTFPLEDLLASKLPTRELSSDDLSAKDTSIMNKVMMGLVARLYMAGGEFPELRSDLESAIGRKPDWKKITEMDVNVSKMLRSVFHESPAREK